MVDTIATEYEAKCSALSVVIAWLTPSRIKWFTRCNQSVRRWLCWFVVIGASECGERQRNIRPCDCNKQYIQTIIIGDLICQKSSIQLRKTLIKW